MIEFDFQNFSQKKLSITCAATETRFPIECLNIKDLTELEIIGGNFTYFPPYISELKHLQKLSIVSTKISVFPKEIFELPKLQYLNLKNNCIEVLPPLFLNNQIKELLLGRNFLNTAVLTTFFNTFKDLRVLDLGHNKLSEIPESLLELHQLKRLNLESNRLRRLDPRMKNLTQLCQLSHLCLNNNPFPTEEKILIARDYNLQF